MEGQKGDVLKLYYAEVVATDATESIKENAVQIKISPQMDGWTKTHLPYAFPLNFTGGATSNAGLAVTPNVGAYLWVTELYGKWWYVFDARVQAQSLANKYYTDIQPNLGQLSETVAPSAKYPDVVSFHYENGLAVNYNKNSSTPEYSIWHPSGSYILIDQSGNIGGYGVGSVQIKNKKGTNMVFDPSTDPTVAYSIENQVGAKIVIETSGKIRIESKLPVLFKTDVTNLKTVLELIITAFQTQIQLGNMGQPIVWNANPVATAVQQLKDSLVTDT
jgi:hypothetical protein